MPAVSVYCVPERQREWYGRGAEFSDLLWNRGIIVDSPHIMERVAKYRDSKTPFPECPADIDQEFLSMGICDEQNHHPVPNELNKINSGCCGADMWEVTYNVWNDDSEIPNIDRIVTCPICDSPIKTKNLRYGEPMMFA